jgi:hypothetical protein
MRETENNLRAMRGELEALGGTPRPKKNLKPLIIAMAVPFLLAVIGAFFAVSVQQTVSAPDSFPPKQVAALPAPVPTAITEIPTHEPLLPPAPARQVNAQWAGKVTRIKDLVGSLGAPCIVDATLEIEGDKQRVTQLSVKCGNQKVYDSSEQLDGMSMSNWGMAEEPGKEAGTFAYSVKYSDTGARSGPRTQASIDTLHGQGAVWSEIIPIFRVEFSLPTFSAPVKGEALMPAKAKGTKEIEY